MVVVVVPVDFSNSSFAAVEYAARNTVLESNHPSNIVNNVILLLHVIDDSHYHHHHHHTNEKETEDDGEWVQRIKNTYSHALSSIAGNAKFEFLISHVKSNEDDGIAKAILHVAQERQAEVIVIGKRGSNETKKGNINIGSVSAFVVYNSLCTTVVAKSMFSGSLHFASSSSSSQ